MSRRLRWLLPLALATAMALSGQAAADNCSYTGAPGGSWHTPSNWSCNQVPDSGDSVDIGSGDDVSVAAAATAGSLSLTGGGTITFSNDVTLAAGTMTADSGTLRGAGQATVAGSFSKTGTGQLTITANGSSEPSADLVLNGAATLSQGSICVTRFGGVNPDQPNLDINASFTIFTADAQGPFPCGGPRIHVNPSGHMIKSSTGTTPTGAGVENDGTITVQAGTLSLEGTTAGVDHAGDFVANAGATIRFSSNQGTIGATGRLGGAGTAVLFHGSLSMAAGSTLDPAVLDLDATGSIALDGTSAMTLPVLNLNGGGFNPTFDTDRPVTATALSVTGAGTINGGGSVTVPSGGSFSKTGTGQLSVTNSGTSGPSADLILNEDAELGEGSIAVARDGDGNPDLPSMQINRDFTVGAGAAPTAFTGSNTVITVNGPSGRLLKEGPGTTTNHGRVDVAGGTVTIAAGQTFGVFGGISQSGGLTDIASGGVLEGSATLTGGVLRGRGQITGNLTNTSGSVRPGTSPGTLTVTGNYSQGAGGTLHTEVAGTTPGTQFDRLAVGGSAALDGTLAIANDPGFDPATSDTFEILGASSVSGTFSNVTGEQASSGKSYTANYNPDDVTLGVALDLPENTAPPAISGRAVEGEALTCAPGTWTGSPTFRFGWLRNGVVIPGAGSSTYTLSAEDVGRQVACRVTGTNGAGSTQATSSAVTPTAKAPPPPPPPPPLDPAQDPQPDPRPDPNPDPRPPGETIRGDGAFSEGTANDLQLACTKLDLLLIDVLPRGRERVYIRGAADLRLAGRTVEVFIGKRLPGRRVGKARIRSDGSFETTIEAPRGRRARKEARYQARVGTTRSQRLRLVRRMVSTTLTRRGDVLKLSGVLRRPFTRPPAFIAVQRYLSCRRRERVAVARVRPNRRGRFTVTIPLPEAEPPAALYRALTRAPTITTGRIATLFTLPRALDL